MRQGLLIIFGLLTLTSCSIDGAWKDENIDPKIKVEINDLDKKIVEAIVTKNPKIIRDISSDILLEQTKDLDGMFASWTAKDEPQNFQIKNQFYLKKSAAGTDSKVFTGLTADHDYTINFKALNKEMFVSVGKIERGLETLGLTMIYGKYDDTWKLNILRIGFLEVEKKDAIDWFRQAETKYKNGNLVDAALDLSLGAQCLKPADQLWQYKLEDEINSFNRKVTQEINNKYKFPIAVETIKSKPEIFRVFPQGMNEGFFPSVFFVTKLNITDSTA
ncbi:MAG TPA: hypothetical protein DGG95_15415, partial [Cytophagales bacterium]|nr:hypothetical protein [Cytophagales bacterium]